MKIVRTLICYGLKQVIGDLAEKGVDLFAERLTDEGAALPQAVKAANERAWQALNVGLAGDSYWEQFKRYALSDATQRALRQQIETVLRDLATATKTRLEQVRTACLNDLMRLRRSKEFKSNVLSVAELERQLAAWQHYTDPKDVIDGAWNAVADVATGLVTDYPDLSRLLRQRVGEEQPLLTALFSFFLRQEIAKNNQLVAAITFDLVGNLSATQENAFREFGRALATVGGNIDATLEELDVIKKLLEALEVKVAAKLDQVGMRVSMLRPQHSLSIHNEGEREAVRLLLRQLRELPAGQQRQVPELLNGLGKLLVGAGEFDKARSTFSDAAQLASDDFKRAECYYNNYRAAIEQHDWAGALEAILEAGKLDPGRFTLFPTHRYKPQRILGAGGFGTAFLCHDEHFDQQVVVKTLHADVMERSIKDVFNEAQVLRRLSHPAIIAVCDCDFADPKDKTRPYIVMDYFPGMTLRAYVEKHGELTPEQYVEVAQRIASGMLAAHRQGVWHRDFEAGQHPCLREGKRFFVKIIDFGLALRGQVVQTSATQTSGEPTILGHSAAGTLAYSAPEQMGWIAGFKAGSYSDVFAFGKTSLFIRLNVESPAVPTRGQWASLSDELADLLEKCVAYHPKDRHQNFESLDHYFNAVLAQPVVPPPRLPSVRIESIHPNPITLVAGSSETLTVRVLRDNFGGELTVGVEALPPLVRLVEPSLIAVGGMEAQIHLTADQNAVPGTTNGRIMVWGNGVRADTMLVVTVTRSGIDRPLNSKKPLAELNEAGSQGDRMNKAILKHGSPITPRKLAELVPGLRHGRPAAHLSYLVRTGYMRKLGGGGDDAVYEIV